MAWPLGATPALLFTEPVTNEGHPEVFEVVWHTVDEVYSDSEVGEPDWGRIRAAQRGDHLPSDRASVFGLRCVVAAPGR